MAIEFPKTAEEVVNRVKDDLKAALPNSNPYLKNSILGALAVSVGYRSFDIQKNVESQQKQFFPQTATGVYLDYFAQLRDVTQLAATPSSGLAVFSGSVDGTNIPAGELLSFSEITFETQEAGTLTANAVTVTSITQTAGVATITFDNNHGLATGVSITVTGCEQVQYNGTHVVTVINSLVATYVVPENTVTPATTVTTIEADYNVASILVQSQDSGANTNAASGSELVLQNPIVNVNDSAFVNQDNLSGGDDAQSEESYRQNIISAYQNPLALFNPEATRRQATSVRGVTRVFVIPITDGVSGGNYVKGDGSGLPGYATIFFVRDEDTSIIPDGAEIAQVRDKILEIIPLTDVPENIHVLAPVGVPVNITFSVISPDTTTMRTAITENIRAFFRGQNGMNLFSEENAGTIFLNNLNLAILQTVDDATGQALESYTLTAPVANIVIQDGEITIEGTVTFL